ncbi:hypothetical protein GZH46_01150, partial [Fragariocoptes setiger]
MTRQSLARLIRAHHLWLTVIVIGAIVAPLISCAQDDDHYYHSGHHSDHQGGHYGHHGYHGHGHGHGHGHSREYGHREWRHDNYHTGSGHHRGHHGHHDDNDNDDDHLHSDNQHNTGAVQQAASSVTSASTSATQVVTSVQPAAAATAAIVNRKRRNALLPTSNSDNSFARRISYPPLLQPARTTTTITTTTSSTVSNKVPISTSAKFNTSWVQASDQLSPEYSRFKRTSCKLRKLVRGQMETLEALVLSSTETSPNDNPVIICNKKRLEKYKDSAAVRNNKDWNVDKLRAQCQYPNRWLEFEHCVLEQLHTDANYKRYQDTLKQAIMVLENPDKFAATSLPFG